MSEDLLVPPLPPGCSLERKDRCGSIAWTCGYISMLEHIPLERKLVACYMRCAWLDEAKKHSTDAVDDVLTMRPYLQVQAEQKAEAWAAWGRESK